MLPTVDDSWDVIVEWLRRHSPPTSARIRPPASEDDLRAAEQSGAAGRAAGACR
ncbi:hypothetical protein [Jidongwangia harbinensis]|uniref:hypothetical protein n=1 Tax=Jidongwangia harbinensis TaxID=2878561 RepID=UPI001CD925FC|nr:hypothetical protein [Jidongwangia harbinensis]MCA2218929.1 hypothetical protein [Jidongwangia harbinensis]